MGQYFTASCTFSRSSGSRTFLGHCEITVLGDGEDLGRLRLADGVTLAEVTIDDDAKPHQPSLLVRRRYRAAHG